MNCRIVFIICLGFFSITSAFAQPKITINTDRSKDIQVRPGETVSIELKIGNYGDQPIGDNYEITAFFNPTEGFLNTRRYMLSGSRMSGRSLGVNEQTTLTFQYTIPDDAPEVSMNLIFSVRSDETLQRNGGYLFMRLRIENEIPLPDLVAKNFLYPRRENFYTELKIQFEVINEGELLAVDTSKVSIYLSKNTVLDSNSILLETLSVPPLVVSEKIKISKIFDFNGIPPAVYNIIVDVDSEQEIKENDEFNNLFIYSLSLPINGSKFPDLYFERLDFPQTMYIGDPIASEMITVRIRNQPIPRDANLPRISDRICNKIYLSSDTRLDENDRLLGTSILSGIDVNNSTALSFRSGDCTENTSAALFPTDIAEGNYYLIFELDAEDVVTEYFERNNLNVREVELRYFSGLNDLVLKKISSNSTAVQLGETVTVTASIFNQSSTDFTGGDSLYLYQRVEPFCFGGSPCGLGNLERISLGFAIPTIPAETELSFSVDIEIPSSFFKGRKFGSLIPPFNPSYEETYIGLSENVYFPQPRSLQVLNAILLDFDPIYPSSNISISLSSPDPTYDSTGIFRMNAVVKNEGDQTAHHITTLFNNPSFGSYYNGFFPNVDSLSNNSFFDNELLYDDIFYYWYIPNLAAGDSAIISFTYQFSSPDLEVWYFDDVSVYATVSAKIKEASLSNNQDRITFNRISNSPNANLPVAVSTLKNFALYPNPVMDELQVTFESKEEQVRYWLYDAQGRVLRNGQWESFKGKNWQRLEVSDLKVGMYYLKIGEKMRRFVVVR